MLGSERTMTRCSAVMAGELRGAQTIFFGSDQIRLHTFMFDPLISKKNVEKTDVSAQCMQIIIIG